MSQLLDLTKELGLTVSGVPDNEDLNAPSSELLDFVNKAKATGTGAYTYGNPAPNKLQEAASQSMKQQSGSREERLAAVEAANPPETTAKGLLSSFLQEAGPEATITGASFLAGGLVGAAAPAATVFGLGAKGANWLNEKLGFEPGDGIADPIAAGRRFLEKIGLDEDPDTFWERVAKGAGVGVDEAITMVLSGNVLSGASGLLSKLPKIGEKVGKAASWVGNLLKTKAGTQVAGGGGSGGMAEAGTIAAENITEDSDMGPVMDTAIQMILPLVGGIAGDITMTQLSNLANFAIDSAKATGKSLPQAVQDTIKRAEDYGIDMMFSDFKRTTVDADDVRNVRELSVPGIRKQRGEVLNPRRQAGVEMVADRFGVDLNDTNADNILTEVANDFYKTREANKDALIEVKNGVINQLSDASTPVPTPKTNKLIEDALAKLERENTPGTEELQKRLYDWQIRLSDAQNLPGGAADNIVPFKSGGTVDPQDKSLLTVESWRKKLGAGFKTSDGVILDDPDGISNSLYRSLRADMGDFVASAGGPGVSKTFEDTMSGLQSMADELDSNSISTLIETVGKNKISFEQVRSIIRNGSQEELATIYRNLSPDGQARSRAAIIADAVEETMQGVEQNTRGVRQFSPNKFSKVVQERGGAKGVFFDGEDIDYLDGFMKVLDDTKRAEISGLEQSIKGEELVQGSNRLITGIVARNPFVAIPALLASKLGKQGFYSMIEKPPLRDLFIKYDALPNRARSGLAGKELLKRMGEVIRAEAQTLDNEEFEASSAEAMERIKATFSVGEE